MSSRYGHRPVGVLEQDVRLAIAVEIASTYYMPAGSGIADHRLGNGDRPVHQPDGHRPVCVLKQDVRLAVAIEISGPDYVPARVDGLHEGLGCRCRSVHQPDGDRPVWYSERVCPTARRR